MCRRRHRNATNARPAHQGARRQATWRKTRFADTTSRQKTQTALVVLSSYGLIVLRSWGCFKPVVNGRSPRQNTAGDPAFCPPLANRPAPARPSPSSRRDPRLTAAVGVTGFQSMAPGRSNTTLMASLMCRTAADLRPETAASGRICSVPPSPLLERRMNASGNPLMRDPMSHLPHYQASQVQSRPAPCGAVRLRPTISLGASNRAAAPRRLTARSEHDRRTDSSTDRAGRRRNHPCSPDRRLTRTLSNFTEATGASDRLIRFLTANLSQNHLTRSRFHPPPARYLLRTSLRHGDKGSMKRISSSQQKEIDPQHNFPVALLHCSGYVPTHIRLTWSGFGVGRVS